MTGTLRVEGNAEGDIDAADSFVVGKTGEVQAKVVKIIKEYNAVMDKAGRPYRYT